jgi:hypothetical protein
MTFLNSTLNSTATPQVISATKPTVRFQADGGLRCNCQRYKVNAVLFGAGECDHTRAVELARKAGAK